MKRERLILFTLTLIILNICCHVGFAIPKQITAAKRHGDFQTANEMNIFLQAHYNILTELIAGTLFCGVMISIYLYRKYYMYPKPYPIKKK